MDERSQGTQLIWDTLLAYGIWRMDKSMVVQIKGVERELSSKEYFKFMCFYCE